jgi:hypothetical protein
MSSIRNIAVIGAIALWGCSSGNLGREGTAPSEPLATNSSALAPDTGYRVVPPPTTAKWVVLLCYVFGQSPGDTAFYTNLFTKAGAPGNIWDYWNNQSYGAFSNDIEVRGWYLVNATNSYAQNSTNCINKSGINPANYFNVVSMFGGSPSQQLGLQTDPLSFNFQCYQNGGCQGQVIADAYSRPSQIEHEMGHGQSLDHSYDDTTTNTSCGAPGDADDNSDIMSAPCGTWSFNGRYSMPAGGSSNGPGLDTWNRYKLGWLTNARKIYFWPGTPLNGNVTTSTFSIRSRSRADLPGQQMILVPATSTFAYEVEWISPEGYDQGVSAPTLAIHKFVYGDDHSYIVKSLPNGYQTAQGNPLQDTANGITIALGPPGADSTYGNFTVSIDTSVNSIWQGSTTGQESATPNVGWMVADLPAGDTVNGARAIQLGTDADNSPLYVCRTWYYGEQLGKVTHGSCAFPWGGSEHWSATFEYLTTSRPWQLVGFQQGNPIPSNAVAGGFENNSPEYVCVELLNYGNGNLGFVPGKMVSWGQCDVSYGGQENFESSYYLLEIN